MKLYNTTNGIVIEQNEKLYLIKKDYTSFINEDNVVENAKAAISNAATIDASAISKL